MVPSVSEGYSDSSMVMGGLLARVTTFVGEIREELKQVTWPTREEIIGSALVVLVGVVLLGMFVSTCSFLWSRAARFILR